MPELSPLEPDEFRKPVETTVLVNSDAVPVYLDSGTGSFCVPGSVLPTEKVPATNLMKGWRELRGLCTDFEKKAYQNEDAVLLYTQRMSEELSGHLVCHQVDMFSAELTEAVEEVNYKLSESKQTAKLRDIDVFQDLKDRLTLMPRVAVFNAWKFSTKEEDAPPLRGDWRSDWRSD